MALSDLAVYSEYAYSSMTEVLRQQIELFNGATDGAISLGAGDVQGDYSDSVLWAKVAGLVRRRNAYGNGTVAEKVLSNLVDTMVKVAAGTPPIRIDPSQFTWIQQNPKIAGAVLGQQLAKDAMGDMLNLGLGVAATAIGAVPAVTTDITAATDKKLSYNALNTAQSKFGDQSGQIVAWIMHSAPLFGLYDRNLTNTEKLFNYGNVNVMRDPFGKLLVSTDSAQLIKVGTPNVYNILGLTPGAVVITQNSDYLANEETKNGGENIARTYQAEWTYNIGLKGFSWDKVNGGKSPNDAALLTSTNWDRYATSEKDLAGVILKTN